MFQRPQDPLPRLTHKWQFENGVITGTGIFRYANGDVYEGSFSEGMKNDIKAVLAYMDKLLDSLPEEKIAEFARSEHFELYKKLFTELGLS